MPFFNFALLKIMHVTIISILFLVINISCQDTARPSTIFPSGVASGDPSYEGFIIWTQVHSEADSTELTWQIGIDTLFSKIIDEGITYALKANNQTVKVVIDNLTEGTTYYYRFVHNKTNQFSRVGRTATIPKNPNKIMLGVVTCAEYESGYFNVYKALAEMENLSAVVHLGDYIYETATSHSPFNEYAAKLTNRHYQPSHELTTLSDYRERYQQYRGDPDLQLLHARYPMINIWDDHEFANNAWVNGAKGHDSPEGQWTSRKEAAVRAFFEWIPIAEQQPIYRSFEFGNLLKLVMLDARLCCRDTIITFERQLLKPHTIVGSDQLNWLTNEISNSESRWNIIGNQIMFGSQNPNLKTNFDRWESFPEERGELLKFIANHQDKIFLSLLETPMRHLILQLFQKMEP